MAVWFSGPPLEPELVPDPPPLGAAAASGDWTWLREVMLDAVRHEKIDTLRFLLVRCRDHKRPMRGTVADALHLHIKRKPAFMRMEKSSRAADAYRHTLAIGEMLADALARFPREKDEKKRGAEEELLATYKTWQKKVESRWGSMTFSCALCGRLHSTLLDS